MKNLIIITFMLLGLISKAQDYDKSLSVLYTPSGYYNAFGVSFTKYFDKNDIGIYTDFKYANQTGVYNQKYDHFIGHVGIVYNWHDLVDPFIAIGMYQENITWYDQEVFNKQMLSSFSIAIGFQISNRSKRIGCQLGIDLGLGEFNRVGVNPAFGLSINF